MTYNHEQYIRDSVLSALVQQNELNIELLVGDDCSSDCTWEILMGIQAQYPAVMTVFHHPVNLGPHENYCFLLAQANGQYIAHLDGDDYWLPGKLKQQVAYLNNHPECPAVYSNALVVDVNDNRMGLFNNPQPEKLTTGYLLRRGNFLNNSTMIYRRAYAKALLPDNQPVIDFALHLRLSLIGDLGYLNEVLAAYRKSSTNSLVTKSSPWVRELYLKAILEVPRSRVLSHDLAQGMAQLLVSVIFYAMRFMDLKLLNNWWSRVMPESPESRLMMCFWVSWGVTQKICNVMWNVILGCLRKGELRVFNRR